MAEYDTLGTLRARLRTRLGYGAAGASAGGVIQDNLNSILQEAQTQLYWTHDWAHLRRYETTTVGADQYLIDFPATANRERIKAISVEYGGVWSPPLLKGISPQMYTNQSTKSVPHRWEPYEQIELFPIADQLYNVRIFYIRDLLPFAADDDPATIDSNLIFALALADGKAHYRHPDSDRYTKRAEALLVQLKGKSWGKDVFAPSSYEAADEPLPKPQVV